MPNIYDNIEAKILDGLTAAFTADQTQRADICVGYINLRGWRCIADAIDGLPGDDGKPPCRLIVGMPNDSDRVLHNHYAQVKEIPTANVVDKKRKYFTQLVAKQLTYGAPTNNDERGLRAFAKQLRSRKVTAKFFGAHPLHAKLYLAHRDDKMAQVVGFVGSSNLTFAGVRRQGELNVDVVEQDAAQKLARWFEDRWEDQWCVDITEELADIIDNSWAGGPIKPYEVYIKTAYELSKEMRESVRDYQVTDEFEKFLLKHQKTAVSLAAKRLDRHGGVIIGDVVGLGKTLVACATAKIYEKGHGINVLVICPARLVGMWEDHMHKYSISGKVFSLGRARQLHKERSYQLVIIDESHNLRNRESKRYAKVRKYLAKNESRVLLLTATPYNKQFADIGSQLRLFVPPEDDLGIVPQNYINQSGGIDGFAANHPTMLDSSLEAFEKSESIQDWRELIRMYMIRRTRAHITKNAPFDEERQQYFLRHASGERFYFPKRVPKCATFAWSEGDTEDQYARLYSAEVVDIVSGLKLPRWGTGLYLLPKYADKIDEQEVESEQKQVIANLARAGNRLIGFARSNLFKRLESCGPAFLLSVRRHILRNAVYLSAIKQNGTLPVGDVFAALDDDFEDESEFNNSWRAILKHERRQTRENEKTRHWTEAVTMPEFEQAGADIYGYLNHMYHVKKRVRDKLDWLPVSFFNSKKLAGDLMADCNALVQVLEKAPKWNPHTDRKLDALVKLCTETHGNEKILVFTEFKDTVSYLHEQFVKRGIDKVQQVTGSTKRSGEYVKRFSPNSNNNAACSGTANELRMLIATDTLSEGQNLQDSRIIVNFDLPWTLIRLVQRAGRVDRIGQQAREVFCYSFLPEEGIEKIISLREKLQALIEENAAVVGSEEQFFEGDPVNLKLLYEEKVALEDNDDETDLVSQAYDIWQQAVKDNEALKARIENLPDVVYSGKRADIEGAIAYIKTTNDINALMQLNNAGEIVSQSQLNILTKLACESDELTVRPPESHHDTVGKAVAYVREDRSNLAGALGGAYSIRNRVYKLLDGYLRQSSVFDKPENLANAVDQIYKHPLQEAAHRHLRVMLNAKREPHQIAEAAVDLYNQKNLCNAPKTDEPIQPRIICSMGLIKR